MSASASTTIHASFTSAPELPNYACHCLHVSMGCRPAQHLVNDAFRLLSYPLDLNSRRPRLGRLPFHPTPSRKASTLPSVVSGMRTTSLG